MPWFVFCFYGFSAIFFFMQIAQNYFMQAAEAGNANAMAFLGKVK